MTRRLGGAEYGRVPLRTVEMERAMGLPEGYTAGFEFSESVRQRMVGNAFHVGVIQHILRNWILLLKEFDSTLGFPREGPTHAQKKRRREAYDVLNDGKARVEEHPGAVREVAPTLARADGRKRADRKARKQKGPAASRQAAWKQMFPEESQRLSNVSLPAVFSVKGWGSAERLVLPMRASKSHVISVPKGTGFKRFVDQVIHDLVLSARSQATWKAYKAWVDVFFAFLSVFGVDSEPRPELWNEWVEVLVVVVAVLALCYSWNTLAVLSAAVSAFMQDHGMGSPYESRLFQLVMRGLPRYLGAGVAKKPAVEAWHVAEIVRMPRPAGFTWLQHLQGVAVVLIGWELFTRSQDFEEFQVCDFIRLEGGMRILVRYAKNDQKGLTRSPVLEESAEEAACPVRAFLRYVGSAGLKVESRCEKVEGQPDRCPVCPPAFPSITKNGGVQPRPMPRARVTEIMRVFFLELAAAGLMTEEEARAFTSKSLRCGGVSQASAEAIRDGVLQGHGGWLQRQSLVHYDLMRPGESSDVSRALNRAVGKFLWSEEP